MNMMHRLRAIQSFTKNFVSLLIFLLLLGCKVHASDSLYLERVDLNGDGVNEKTSLQFTKPDDLNQYHAALFIESNGRTYSKLLGDSFWPDLTTLDILVIGKGISPFVVVNAATGAHSESRIVYSFNGHEVAEVLSVVSDAPSITEKDIDNDGTKEIIVKRRDYEKDPLTDSREVIYKWDGSHFIGPSPKK